MFENFKRRRENNRVFLQKQIDRLVSDSKDVRIAKINARTELAKDILNKKSPCNNQTVNMEKLSEFVSDGNYKLGTKRIIALWVTISYLLINIVVIGCNVFPIDFLFKIYMTFHGIAGMVILSYFYASIKGNKLF